MNPIDFRKPEEIKDPHIPKEGFRPFEKVEGRRPLKRDSGEGQGKSGMEDEDAEGVAFEKVMNHEIQEGTKERSPKKQSLFDLSSHTSEKKAPEDAKASSLRTSSPFGFQPHDKKIETTTALPPPFAPFLEKDEKKRKEPLTSTSSKSAVASSDSTQEDLEKVVREKGALEGTSGMKPYLGTAQEPLKTAAPEPGYMAEKIKKIEEIVAQIVANLYTIDHKGVNITTLELKRPPLFEGALVSLTSDPKAPGQVLTFENLKPEAKILLDEKLAQETLQKGLKAEGIVLYRIITTTEPPALYLGKSDSREDSQKEKKFGQDKEEKQPNK